jgi:hypothetical protein
MEGEVGAGLELRLGHPAPAAGQQPARRFVCRWCKKEHDTQNALNALNVLADFKLFH